MNKEKYEVLIEELTDLLKTKNETILIQKYEIERLKNKIDDITKSNINIFKKIADEKSKIEKRSD